MNTQQRVERSLGGQQLLMPGAQAICFEIDKLQEMLGNRLDILAGRLNDTQKAIPATLECHDVIQGGSDEYDRAQTRLVTAQARKLELENEARDPFRRSRMQAPVNPAGPEPTPWSLEEKLMRLGNHQVELWREADGWLICFQAKEGKRTFGGVSLRAVVEQAIASLDAK